MGAWVRIDQQMARSGRAIRLAIAGTALAAAIAADVLSGPRPTPLIAYVLVVIFAVWHLDAGTAILLSVVAACSQSLAARPWETGLLSTPVPYWDTLARTASYLAIIWVVRAGRNRAGRPAPHADTVADATRGERGGSVQDEMEIREAEQRRIGRALHDGLSQQLTATMLASKTLEERLVTRSPAEADRARMISELLSEAMVQVRDVSRCLHPPDLAENGLQRALARLAATTQRVSGIPCRFACRPTGIECDVAVATHLYRIAQEAVNNAVRHAKPGRIVIALSAVNGRIELTVGDNGIGCVASGPEAVGLGLRTMRERAQAVGGQFELRRNPRGGTRVVCSVTRAVASCGHTSPHALVASS